MLIKFNIQRLSACRLPFRRNEILVSIENMLKKKVVLEGYAFSGGIVVNLFIRCWYTNRFLSEKI